MEAASLALAVVATFKEVYIVSRFIYRTLSSAKHNKIQKQAIEKSFRSHILYLQSLGLLFFSSGGITQNHQLDRLWLEQILAIFEDVRISCSDYARIASKKDETYIEFSPELHPEFAVSGAIEFDLGLPLIASASGTASLFQLSLGWVKSRAKTSIADPLHWAFMEKRRLERVLGDFQTLREKLQEILPLFTAFRSSNPLLSRTVLERMISDQNAQRLGLASHARLQLLQGQNEPDTSKSRRGTDFNLKNYLLDASTQANTLTVGSLKKLLSRESADEVLVEYKSYLPFSGDESAAEAQRYTKKLEMKINKLSTLLSSAGEDEFHTLPFKGYIHQPECNRHAFIFQYPSEAQASEQISLHTMIEAEGCSKDLYRLSLDDRYSSARCIAQSIGVFHSDGWVHKSIRSQSVVFFQKTDHSNANYLVRDPYLVNFEYTRPECDNTLLDYDLDFEKDLYRHPERQGVPSKPFNKLYDLYALGVVLLEIGMWQSAKSIYESASWNKQVSASTRPGPQGIQKMFLELAKRKLAHKMGKAYQEAVVACLEGVYKEKCMEANFGMVFHNEIVEKLGGKRVSAVVVSASGVMRE